MSIYAEVLSDECTCRWVNYSDHGGWHLRSRNPQCPVHGDMEADE